MIALDDFQSLQRKVDILRDKKAKAAGALEQKLAQLKTDFNVETIKEAKALLKKLIKDRIEAHRKYTKLKKKFEKEWNHVLSEL